MAGKVAPVAVADTAARRIRAEGRASTLLAIKPLTPARRGSDAAVGVTALRAAVGVANATAGPEVVTGGGVAAGVGGPTVIVRWDGETKAAIQPWLTALAAALSEAGQVGTIQPAPQRHFDPAKKLDPSYPKTPTMLAGYRLTSYPSWPANRRFGLTPNNGFRRSAARLAAWGAELTNAPRYVLVKLSTTQLVEVDLTEWITSAAIIVNGHVQVVYYDPGRRRARSVSVSQLGQLVVHESGAARPWRELVDQAREQLLIDPTALDVGQIRNTDIATVDWDDLHYTYRTPGHLPPNVKLYSLARHLWHERVIDAAAIQLLTGAHLAHATDLHRWRVREVALDRYLVEATDLTPWFAQPAPDPQVLGQARHDFGDMILTNDHERATPGPYSHIY